MPPTTDTSEAGLEAFIVLLLTGTDGLAFVAEPPAQKTEEIDV